MVAERSALAVLAAGGALATPVWIQAIGYSAQAFYFCRVVIQWFASERAKRPVAPRTFWYFSAAGAVLNSVYCLLQSEYVLLPGFLITLGIYLRNLAISLRGKDSPGAPPVLLLLIALAVVVAFGTLGLLGKHDRPAPTTPWLMVAILGTGFWVGRFLLQWHHAERHGKSEFPPAFWWMTIAGSSLLTLYSLHRVDLPFVLGFVLSWVAPARNLMLHYRHRRAAG